MKPYPIIKSDVLVIGSGGAGLRSAIEARDRGCDVLLISKSALGRGNNTAVAGSAMAAAAGWSDPRDNPEVHFHDTLETGRFINSKRLVEVMVHGAEQQVYDLERFGVEFAKDGDQYFILEIPSHTYPRVVKPRQGIGTGHTLPLLRYATQIGVRTMEKIFITKILKNGDSVVGAMGVDLQQNTFVFHSKSVILASGGLCQVFLRTSNTPGATGDGYALAYEAGATLQDMEFIQFLPATLRDNTKRLFLYEAFVESGAVFKNALGENVAVRHGILTPKDMSRDKVARAVMLEILEGRGIDHSIVLDFTTIPDDQWKALADMRARSKSLRTLKKEAYPIAPSAHYAMGGVIINEKCETGIEGLYAAGEVCGGIHGANRLGPNAITDIFVFGTIAGEMASDLALDSEAKLLDDKEILSEMERLADICNIHGQEDVKEIKRFLKTTMWKKGGIVRHADGMREALEEVTFARDRLYHANVETPHQLWHFLELSNMLTVSEMVLKAALMRTESRGGHYRIDYPNESPEWLKNIAISNDEGKMKLYVSV